MNAGSVRARKVVPTAVMPIEAAVLARISDSALVCDMWLSPQCCHVES